MSNIKKRMENLLISKTVTDKLEGVTNYIIPSNEITKNYISSPNMK